ncbi:MAG: cytochrome P450 [Proteobacteria bacterium]|nr:cytochrome P450 [Pseudomonadota bacterium]
MPNHPQHSDIRLLDGHWYVQDPLGAYRWLRENAPLYYSELDDIWAASGHEQVMFVSKNRQLFCSGNGSRPHTEPERNPASMINMDDPMHRMRRGLVNKGFTPRRIEDHEEKVRRLCREIVEKVAPLGRCDFVRDIAAPLPMIMIGDMLGVAPEDRGDLLRWSDDLIAGTTETASPEIRARANRAGQEYGRYIQEVIRDRRSRPEGDDLISLLVHAELEGERLDDEALHHESLLILVGGDETTRHVISGGMEMLIRHPDQRRKLIEDPGRIPVAVEEMLRWVSPIKNMNRTATRDVEIAGEKIREGQEVLLLYHSANRDERVFERPGLFDVEREPNDHVAFGGYGAHFCLGASLARLELRVMFDTLLELLPDMTLATDDPLPLRPSNFIVGIEEMPVEFTPRG